MLSRSQQKSLLAIARKSVEVFLLEKSQSNIEISDGYLIKATEGAFVTIKTLEGELRGCIGVIENDGMPLYQLVSKMAIAAATEDNRFLSLKADDLHKVFFEISILSKPQIIENWRDIELNNHGVIIEKEGKSGVFLPQVAKETGWNLETFLGRLCVEKAGLREDAYLEDKRVVLKVFEAQVFSE